jgi:hypothetical protein
MNADGSAVRALKTCSVETERCANFDSKLTMEVKKLRCRKKDGMGSGASIREEVADVL